MINDLSDQQALSNLSDYNQANLNTAIPGEVIKYDRKNQTVDVKIHFTEWLKTEEDVEEQEWSELSAVPLMAQQTDKGNISITFPVKKGDIVFIMFAQRSLDEWSQTEGNQKITPKDLRIHDPSDAVAFLGPGTAKRKLPESSSHDDNLVINVSGTQIIVTPDGTVSIVGNRLNIGSESASTAIARGDNTESRLSAIEGKINDILSVALVASGQILPPVPPILPGASVSSGKAFTND